MSEKQKELLNEVDESKRGLLKKIFTAGAAVYVAPMMASFSLSGSFARNSEADDDGLVCHPVFGANMPTGEVKRATPGHLRHGDVFVSNMDLNVGDSCDL